MNKKCLYISPSIKVASGGAAVSHRNKRLLCKLVGEGNLYPMAISRKTNNPIRMLWNDITEKSFYGLDSIDKKAILRCINENHISIVFLDSSRLGGLATLIHKTFPNVKVITFFHNIEVDFEKMCLKLSRKWYFAYRVLLAEYNERQAVQSSDIIICINGRDSKRMYEKYGRKSDVTIPVTLDSQINEDYLNQNKMADNVPHLLFFGSYFLPNIEGIKIFVDNVMPKVNATLTIAGTGMEQLKPHFQTIPRVNVCGFVENIDEMYSKADIVVLPIFSGSGMKVKTAEALKYGKYIIASNEALEGYNTDHLNGVVRCYGIVDFITAINSYDPHDNIQVENRKYFLANYSDKSVERIFKSLLY